MFDKLRQKLGLFLGKKRSDDKAKKYLNNLREEELSVGAAFKRGEAVHTAPGQIRSDVNVVAKKKNQAIAPAKNESALGEKKDDGDIAFATSLAVTMATDSPILGYATGGSFSGAAVGAILNDCSSKDDD